MPLRQVMRGAFACALLGAAGVGCHTALLHLERSGSAAISDTAGLRFRRFFDGRYIPLPAKPFVNCFDVVADDLPVQTCDQTQPGVGYRGYSTTLVPRQSDDPPPWWIRDTRPFDLLSQLRTIRNCYAGAPKASCDANTELPSAVTLTASPHDVTVPKEGTGDPRIPRLPIAVCYEQTLADPPGTLLWLATPARPIIYYAGVVTGPCQTAAGRDGTRIVIPAPITSAGRGSSYDDIEQVAARLDLVGRLPRSVFSFIHLSDAQIREPAAKLGGQRVSDQLDPLIPTFAHDYEQELFSAFYYEAIIRTINRERDEALESRSETWDGASFDTCVNEGGLRDCPLEEEMAATLARTYRPPAEMMVHTGDSVDAGLLSEFHEFRGRTDLLTIPWFGVVGNHDVLGIGNLALEPESSDRRYWRQLERIGDPDDSEEPDAIACTPTTRLLREYFIESPKRNGQPGEDDAANRPKTKGNFSLAPIAMREVCLELEVKDSRGAKSDRFVADRRRSTGMPWSHNATSSYVEAYCRNRDDWRIEDGIAKCSRHLRLPVRCGLDQETPNYPARVTDPVESADGDGASAGSKIPACSLLNGFDTEEPATFESRDGTKTKYWKGYYAFFIKNVTLDGESRPLWLIALNTTSDKGAYGSLCPEGGKDLSSCAQLAWLEKKLGDIDKAHGLTMVFAHHPISGIENKAEREQLKTTLFAHDVIAFIGGHTHSPLLRVVEETCKDGKKTETGRACGKDARRLWEMIGPSTLEFPQQARQVTIYDVPGSGLAYFEILSFSPELEGAEKSYVDRAQKSAERDQCASWPRSCVGGQPRPPEQYRSYARLWFRVPPMKKASGR